jgi:2,3-bisphosphoglycerate-dependent phosphoglycerate mutase
MKNSRILIPSIAFALSTLSVCILLAIHVKRNDLDTFFKPMNLDSPIEKNLVPPLSSTVTRFLLVRHGRTDWNDQKRIQGLSDIPLNERGIRQAQQVAHLLASEEKYVSAIYASDLQRAADTAREIAKAFNQNTISDPGLREICAGEAEGLSEHDFETLYGPAFAQLEVVYADRWERWHQSPIPGGESKANMIRRVERCLKKIAKDHEGKAVVVVTHSGIMKTLITHLTEKVEHTPNCCVAEFHYCHTTDTLSFKSLKCIDDC